MSNNSYITDKYSINYFEISIFYQKNNIIKSVYNFISLFISFFFFGTRFTVLLILQLRPRFDFVIESIPRTGAGTAVMVTVQSVRGGDVPRFTPHWIRLFTAFKAALFGFVVSNQWRGKWSTVVGFRMTSNVLPNGTLINCAILTHTETVCDIWPT